MMQMGGPASYMQNSPGMVPSTNPVTGKPDYSLQVGAPAASNSPPLQWSQYYRALGMHEQADAIEYRLKQQQKSVQ